MIHCRMRTFAHSYERDLNRIQRPILRLILERDATPARPMVLVVSSIRWAPQEMDEDGHAILLPHPTLELTDGWYLVRAEVDQALARAARRRKIRLGTKLVVAGAKVRPISSSHLVAHLVFVLHIVTAGCQWRTQRGFEGL